MASFFRKFATSATSASAATKSVYVATTLGGIGWGVSLMPSRAESPTAVDPSTPSSTSRKNVFVRSHLQFTFCFDCANKNSID
jgi:hypothetical protein